MSTVNVLTGIIGSLLCEQPPCLLGVSYLQLLTEELPQLVAMQQTRWSIHAGAPAHFTHDIRQFLGSHYPH